MCEVLVIGRPAPRARGWPPDWPRVTFVDAADITAVAVRAPTDERPHNTDHPITGPEALSYGEAAAIISGVTGRAVTHRAVDVPGLLRRRSDHPPEFAAILAALEAGIAAGAEDRVTDTVARVTGTKFSHVRDQGAAGAADAEEGTGRRRKLPRSFRRTNGPRQFLRCFVEVPAGRVYAGKC